MNTGPLDLFFSFIPKPFQLYTHISTHQHAHEFLSDNHKYFTFDSHISAFTYTYMHMNLCLHICKHVEVSMYEG